MNRIMLILCSLFGLQQKKKSITEARQQKIANEIQKESFFLLTFCCFPYFCTTEKNYFNFLHPFFRLELEKFQFNLWNIDI